MVLHARNRWAPVAGQNTLGHFSGGLGGCKVAGQNTLGHFSGGLGGWKVGGIMVGDETVHIPARRCLPSLVPFLVRIRFDFKEFITVIYRRWAKRALLYSLWSRASRCVGRTL